MSKESIDKYYANIDSCADSQINQLIANGLAEHAVYLMTKMFSKATKNIRLFTGSLVDDVKRNSTSECISVYKSQELIEAAVSFLAKDGSRLEILVQDDFENISTKSFVLAMQQKKAAGEIKGCVEIRKANASNKELANHFMVMDSLGYRLELNHEETRAIANFGDSDFADKLAKVFDSILFKNGTNALII